MINKVLLVDIIPGAGKPAIKNFPKRVIVDYFNVKLENNHGILNVGNFTGDLRIESLKPLF